MAAAERAEAPPTMIPENLFRHSIPEPNSGCWLWTGSTVNGGYGRAWHNGKPQLAHRVMYAEAVGEIGDRDVCHRCDMPCCINPDHLFLGSVAENLADRDAKGRQARGTRQGSVALTEWQVREIRASLLSERKLSVKYGVAPSTIRKARKRITWAHLP